MAHSHDHSSHGHGSQSHGHSHGAGHVHGSTDKKRVLVAACLTSLMREAAHVLLEGVPGGLDRDLIAKDLEGSVEGVREVHHMHVWSLDGASNIATLHACLNEGVDAHMAVGAIKKRLTDEHGIAHATVEPEFGHCAGADDEHDHDHDHDHAHAAARRGHYH